MQKTYLPKVNEIEQKWYIVDAKDKILGRLATKIATILRGKNKIIYTPNMDTVDNVIVINAEKISVTGKKMQDKIYHHYSGFHSGYKSASLETMLKKNPEKVIELAVKRMIPSGPLGYKIRTKLKVYAGDKHPHAAQKPITLTV